MSEEFIGCNSSPPPALLHPDSEDDASIQSIALALDCFGYVFGFYQKRSLSKLSTIISVLFMKTFQCNYT